MIDYTIKEYNTKTREYTTIGYVTAESSGEAKSKYIASSGWKPQEDVMLFARIPLCR